MPLRMKDLLTFAQSFALWRGGRARRGFQIKLVTHCLLLREWTLTPTYDSGTLPRREKAMEAVWSATGTSVSSPKQYREGELL